MDEEVFDGNVETTKNFQTKFDKYQKLCKTVSKPLPSSRPPPSVSDIIQIHHRKTSSGNRKKKITPLGKGSHASLSDHVITEKARDRIRQMVTKVCDTRPWVDSTRIHEKLIEFCNHYKIQFPKSKERMDEVILYCLIMSGRFHNIFFDTHILSIDLEMKSKDLNKILVENLPSLTSLQNTLFEHVLNVDKMSLLPEYNNLLKPIIENFNSTNTMSDEDYQFYKIRTEEIFHRLDADDIEEGDRQFCVTPNKVFIYSIFELIRKKNSDVTERSICDYLAKRFNVPRVTIEKMKRLVSKSSRAK
jgi:hypothetical protein